ncbi:Y-family DNA polymerase [Enterococcus faecalis]
MKFDYQKEARREVLCIDVKSFYASVECVTRGLHPLKTLLVVMSRAENTDGLVLAASPLAKSQLGLTNVMRRFELPDHPHLKIVPPRMGLYIQENMKINGIYKQYVAEEDLLVYSIDESFLDVTKSRHLFATSTYELARKIQAHIHKATGLYVTVGIGDNPLLAKLALDNGAKHNRDFIAEWRYEDVAQTVWQIQPITNMWGIGKRTAKRLTHFGIHSVKQLAQANFYDLKEHMGLIGSQLYAHAWGIDRSVISDVYVPLEKSYGNSQILPRDYTKQAEIEIVIREMADQVAARIRKHQAQTGCVSLFIGYSATYIPHDGSRGFRQQMKISPTNNSQQLIDYCLQLFRRHFKQQEIRQIGITYSKLTYQETPAIQLNLFKEPEAQLHAIELDYLIDTIRNRYGYTSLIHANSLKPGGTSIVRSSLIGGHAGGMDGLQ